MQIEQVEGETEISSSPTPSPSPISSEPLEDDRETFKIGDRVADFLSDFKGFVVALRGECPTSLPLPLAQNQFSYGFRSILATSSRETRFS